MGWAAEPTSGSRDMDPFSIPTPPVIELRETQKTLATARIAAERRVLTILSGPSAGKAFVITAPEHVFGRGEVADFRISDEDVSRRHARIARTLEGKLVIEDLDSTNGTWVGGKRVDRCELAPGDRIQLGPNLILRYAITDDV